MFNFDEHLTGSINKYVDLPTGQWAEQTILLVSDDDKIRVLALLYYFVPLMQTGIHQPQIIDMEIIRNGMLPFYKDFVNFDGAWRDELGRYSTDINDLLPFENLPLHSTGDDDSLIMFEVNLTDEIGNNHGN